MAAAARKPKVTKDTPYDADMLEPDFVKAMSFLYPGEESDRMAIIIGETHPYENEKKDTEQTIRFLHNFLAQDKDKKLYIEASPELTHNEPERNLKEVRGTINIAAQRLKEIHKDRVVPMDRRKEETAPRATKDMLPEEKEEVARRIREEVSPLYADFPKFEEIVEREVQTRHLSKGAQGVGKFHAPLLDAQILRKLIDMRTDDTDTEIPVFYVGDAHRRNVINSLPEELYMDVPLKRQIKKERESKEQVEGSGLAYNELPPIERKPKMHDVFQPNWNFY
jgi:hypothetical protein